MKVTKTVIAVIALVLGLIGPLAASNIQVEAAYDLKQALTYSFNNNIDSLILTTSGGVYTTTDTLPLTIEEPLTIVAQEGLAEKPILTHSDPDSNVLEIFRVCNDITIEGVVFDGGHDQSHGLKYALRFGHGEDENGNPIYAEIGTDIIVRDCDFVDIYRDKISEPEMEEGHAIYFLRPQNVDDPTVKAGNVIVENCNFTNIGDEAIRMSETEKYDVQMVMDTLIVRNSTFNNIDAECIRMYGDTDHTTEDAYVLVENITVINSATRIAYFKNNAGAILRNVIVAHGRQPAPSRMDRGDWIAQVQLPGSYIANVDTFDLDFILRADEVWQATKGAETWPYDHTYWGFDPQFVDWENGDYSLPSSSDAYYAAHDGGAIGDRGWATETPSQIFFELNINGHGDIVTTPEIQGQSYPSGTEVTLEAVPDSTYTFTGWSGDLSGETNPTTLTVDNETHITATFQSETGTRDNGSLPVAYGLEQNYPNPFNPTTSITFSLKKSGQATLELYNVLGKRVRTLTDGNYTAGQHTLTLNGSNLPSGVYYYKLTAGQFTSVKKCVLMK
ncbi:MAG: T9SS type A sorting domain-containing protein [Candidatus Marinimicrobia bacterium]|nr:T9SS type A sorting domain-containing protein [Candidatus Neomarinimicrobiota bacterium]MCF7828920.1 T9SS type A sorting domain-containing protein [Candidatus Neomarinimicrobiota bacterium]MCF7879880.1 T9SS type A sorting domain-containing protein [Candidatus Neomarinimicrobiota bacterium]